MCDDVGLAQESTGVVTPGLKHGINAETEMVLDITQASRYRALVARAKYVAQSRPDMQFDTKELCRDMIVPTGRGWNGLQRFWQVLDIKPKTRSGIHKAMTS